MFSYPKTTCKQIPLWIIFLILIIACSNQTKPAPATTIEIPSLSEERSDLSAEQVATLRSLKIVDDYPLYVMHYSGAYTDPQTGINRPPVSDFACSLFATLPQTGNKLFGRNFDWEFSPALLLFTDPPDGYASVSIIDIMYLGISANDVMSLTDLPLERRTALLAAPSMPADGMNEYGLAIGMAAVPETSTNDTGYDPSKPTIGSIGMIREVLDHARTVKEAVKLFEKHNIDFRGGPPIHYLIADAGGEAVLVEIFQGELIVIPNEEHWHLATNHLRCVASGDGGCPRYSTLSKQLTKANGQLSEKQAMRLLSDVAQEGTQWSVVYNLTTGDVSAVIGQAYKNVYPFHLDRVSP